MLSIGRQKKTDEPDATGPGALGASDPLVDFYEHLRAAALGDSASGSCHRPRGLVLFLRRGAAAWMKAWGSFRPQKRPTTSADLVFYPLESAELGRKMTAVLAQMVLLSGGSSG